MEAEKDRVNRIVLAMNVEGRAENGYSTQMAARLDEGTIRIYVDLVEGKTAPLDPEEDTWIMALMPLKIFEAMNGMVFGALTKDESVEVVQVEQQTEG